MKEIEFGKDGDFNETRFVNTLNADLANDLGNLLNRTLGMAKKYCGSTVPDLGEIPEDNLLQQLGRGLADRVGAAYEALAFSKACTEIMALVQAGNKYIDEQAPWKLYKEGKQSATEQVLYGVLESVRLAAYLLSPVIPRVSSAIYQQLGFSMDFDGQSSIRSAEFDTHASWGALPAKQKLGKAQPVFERLELVNAATSN